MPGQSRLIRPFVSRVIGEVADWLVVIAGVLELVDQVGVDGMPS